MRRLHLTAAVSATLLGGTLLAGCGSDGDDRPERTAGRPTHDVEITPQEVTPQEVTPQLAADVAAMRAGTAGYVDDLDAALDDGYFMITQHMPDQGYHFLNPAVEGFDPGRPPILMYARDGDGWQLVGFEWVFPEQPAEPPLDGATYGSFPAACHYDDGLFVEAAAEAECGDTHPDSGAAFTFWHPDLATLHVWAWLHNPAGIYHPTNPMLDPYNAAGGAGGHPEPDGPVQTMLGPSIAE